MDLLKKIWPTPFMIKEKDVHPFKRFVLPILSLVGVCIIVAASIIKHQMSNVWYLIVFAAIMALGAVVKYVNDKKHSTSAALDAQETEE